MNGSMFIGTWWALVPPLLAILLAFVTKEVYSSLFIGSAVGVLLYTGFHPWDAFTSFFEILRNSMNINILPATRKIKGFRFSSEAFFR